MSERFAARYDVIIVGAGPAGIFAALQLSHAKGVSILLLEKGKDIDGRVCPASQMGEQPDEEAISQIAGDFLQTIYLGRIEICLGRHARSGNLGSASACLSGHTPPTHLNASPVTGAQGYDKSQRV